MAIFSFSDRSVVRIRGEGAQKLLHDTLTCRFDEGLAGTGRWFALLSPQGKVQVEGLVTAASGAFWLDMKTELVPDFIKRMKLYRLRAKAEIEDLPTHEVHWSPVGQTPAGGPLIAYRDERGPGLGTRFILDAADQGEAADGPAGLAFDAARIRAGVAEFGSDFSVNEAFPHDIGMDLLGGVDFRKGCYIGQEVVSRMQHRGTARRRPVIVSCLSDGVAAGAAVVVGEREAGTIGTPAGGAAVGLLRLDRLADPALATVAGHRVHLALPLWATYAFGESGAAD